MGAERTIQQRLDDYVQELQKQLELSAVILIGSRARQDALATSDVDLLVVSNDFQPLSYLQRLHLATQHWVPPPSLEVFPHTETEVLERSNHLALHILEALDQGRILFDTGFFQQLQLKFKKKIKQGEIYRYQYGYALR